MVRNTSMVVIVEQVIDCKVVHDLETNCPFNQEAYLHQVADWSIVLGLQFILLLKLREYQLVFPMTTET